MTIDEGNALIAKFIGLKLKSDKKTYELTDDFQKILKCKTTQFVKFNENLELLYIVIKKIASIKDLFISFQCDHEGSHVCLYYKATFDEGDWRLARFSCERTKSLEQLKQAIFEVISTFCGWYYNHPECQTDIEYELDYVTGAEQTPPNWTYMKPIEVVCPHCKRIYREEDVRQEESNSDN